MLNMWEQDRDGLAPQQLQERLQLAMDYAASSGRWGMKRNPKACTNGADGGRP
jgi:hypothetical protein